MLHRAQPVVDSRIRKLLRINAESAEDLVTGHINAPRVEVDSEDVEEDVVAGEDEEAVVDGKADNRRMLLWRRRRQRLPKVYCKHHRELPQCPALRETSCALSWPARTAVGAVGWSGAS